MKKILLMFHSLDEAIEYTKKGGDQFAPHHFWSYDYLVKSGHQVDFIRYRPDTLLNKVGRKFRINNLQQQVNCLRKHKDYDLVFSPYIEYTFLLATLRVLGLFQKPIITVAHSAYVVNSKNWLRKIRQFLVRFFYLKGIDRVLFVNKVIFDESNKYPFRGNTSYLKSWGGDFEFFKSFSDAQVEPPSADYIYSTGGSFRDFKTLVRAFKDIDFELRITTTGQFCKELEQELTPNIKVYNSLKPSLTSTAALRREYYHALAVAIPLLEVEEFEPYGYAVLMEAMAMGKPVIISANKALPFHLEEEKIGFVIDFGDVEGWKKAVNYLIDHPEEAAAMGRRALWLAEHKYNYRLFAKDIVKWIDHAGRSEDVKLVKTRNIVPDAK